MSNPAPPPPPAPNDDKKKVLQILGPALAVAAVVTLVAVMVGTGTSPSSATNKAGGPAANAGATMAGKFDFPLDGPDWKPVGGEGLRAWDVKEGTGDPCPPGVKVTVHYTGWLTDGKKFDSSLDRGKPASFSLNEVIKGWTQGLPGMKAGGIRRVYIPSALGYGPGGKPPTIPPAADLVFEVEMLGF